MDAPILREVYIASFLARCLEAVRNDLVISLQPSNGCKFLGQTFLK